MGILLMGAGWFFGVQVGTKFSGSLKGYF